MKTISSRLNEGRNDGAKTILKLVNFMFYLRLKILIKQCTKLRGPENLIT